MKENYRHVHIVIARKKFEMSRAEGRSLLAESATNLFQVVAA